MNENYFVSIYKIAIIFFFLRGIPRFIYIYIELFITYPILETDSHTHTRHSLDENKIKKEKKKTLSQSRSPEDRRPFVRFIYPCTQI